MFLAPLKGQVYREYCLGCLLYKELILPYQEWGRLLTFALLS